MAIAISISASIGFILGFYFGSADKKQSKNVFEKRAGTAEERRNTFLYCMRNTGGFENE